jgi:hypothetical protein
MCKTYSSTVHALAIGKFDELYVLKAEPYGGTANCRSANGPSLAAAMTATPRLRFDEWLLAQTGRVDSVGDIAREFSEDRCAGDIRTPEQLISHIERVHHLSEPGIRAFEQARSEYLRGRADPLRGRVEETRPSSNSSQNNSNH